MTNLRQIWEQKGKDQTLVGQAIAALLKATTGEDFSSSVAQGTVAMSGVGVDGDTVTIAGVTFELWDTVVTSVTAGNTPVDISGGATAANVVTALTTAIEADTLLSALFVVKSSAAGATLNLISKTKTNPASLGTITETLTNGTVAGFVVASEIVAKETLIVPGTAAMTTAAELWFYPETLTAVDFVYVTEVDVGGEAINTDIFVGAAVVLASGLVTVDLSGSTPIPALATDAIAIVEAFQNL